MAYNFTNLGNQPLPLFGGLPNANGATTMQQHHHHQSYMNQLAATSLAGTTHTVAAATVNAQTKRELNERQPPEPPPAPILGSLALSSSSSSSLSPKMTQNQGHAPMDLENDSEPETTTTPTLMTSSSTAAATATTTTGISTSNNNTLGTTASKAASLHMHEPNLFLNGLLSTPSLTAAAYMFFPGAAQTAAATTNAAAAATANPMLMDATAMMAAMQHMQSYAGYNMAADATAAAADGSAQVPTGLVDAYGGASTTGGTAATAAPAVKEVIKTKGCVLFPPNPNAPPPTIRDRPPGCRTVFVGGLPENITEEIIHEIFDPCGEITTLRMSKKNFCHIRYRHESSIDRAIYLSGYRVRISNGNEQANFGRLHVDYAQARDDQYEYECKQRQMQREQRHRERMSLDRLRSQSPPPMPHYTDHEASLVAENLRNNDTFLKGVQTITVWLERGDCTKRNANVFYSMIQSTHAHVRRLHTDKQQLEDELRKARESYRKQMLTMSSQFTQIEKVFNAASHKKVWDHFTKAQRKNIDQWKKLATELRSVQIEDDEMEMSDDDRDYTQSNNSHAKRTRYDHDSLKEENDSLRCQLEAIRNEMSMERTDIKYDSDFREKQIKVLQETIRNMQTQLMQTKMREQKDGKTISELEQRLKEAGVKQLLLKTKIKETYSKLKDKETISSVTSETSETLFEDAEEVAATANMPDTGSESRSFDNEKNLVVTAVEVTATNVSSAIIDIDVYKSDDDVKIIEDHATEDDGALYIEEPKATKKVKESETSISHNIAVESTTAPMACSTQQKQHLLNEAKVIALTAAYLVVQPFGVSNRLICGYLNRLMQSSLPQQHINAQQLNDTLSKYCNLFTTISTQSSTPRDNDKAKHLTNDDSTTEMKQMIEDLIWKFCGFQQACDEA